MQIEALTEGGFRKGRKNGQPFQVLMNAGFLLCSDLQAHPQGGRPRGMQSPFQAKFSVADKIGAAEGIGHLAGIQLL